MRLLLALFFLLSLQGFAQYEITIEAFTYDNVSKTPVPYVNIGFVKKGIGTVSDENGYFKLKYDEDAILENEILQFSSLGYETITIKANQLFDVFGKSGKVFLEPKDLNLYEVVVNATKRIDKKVGVLKSSVGAIGYWKEDIALGGEIATRIRIHRKNSKLKELQLKVLENLSDSIKIRVNIYDYKKRQPGNNLLNTNIFHVISLKKGIETINLKPYNIIVNDDIVVSIELVEVFGDRVGFALGGFSKNGLTYTRYISQDKWKTTGGLQMNLSLLTAYSEEKEGELQDRPLPSKIALLWDASASMNSNRDISKEFEMITAYFKAIKNTTVDVMTFNTHLSKPKTISIEKGNSEALINYLKQTHYDGATDYSKIEIKSDLNYDTVLLFTDGNATLGNLKFEPSIPVFSINSKVKSDNVSLQDLAFLSDGHYINLSNNSIDVALNFMLKKVSDQNIYGSTDIANNLYGKVYDSLGPVQGASIRVKNSLIETISKDDGSYSIPATYGDVLKVTRLGMLPKEVAVPQNKKLDIELKFDGVVLEEIQLRSRSNNKDKFSEIFKGDRVSRAAAGGSYLSDNDVRTSDIFFSDIMRRVPGVFVRGPRENATYSVRLRGFGDPLFFVDGGQIKDVNLIDPQTVKGIAVLRSLAATSIYGADGSNGVIIIRTKGNYNRGTKNINYALIKGNNYAETIPSLKNNTITTPYINGVLNSSAEETGSILYRKAKQNDLSKSIPFYIEVADHFLKWDKEKAYTILSNIAEIAPNNAKALKALAFKLVEMDKLNEAKFIYERIRHLRPYEAQSYRDLALIYQQTGDYEKAMILYKQMISNAIEGVDFAGLEKTIISELRHLLAFHRSKVDYSDLPSELLNSDFKKKDIRVVFEWNDKNVEFDLQFVDPKKKYFIWKHTFVDNKKDLDKEIIEGIYTQEFIIDKSSPRGEWIINAQFLNKEPILNPTFLKYSVYKNYGLSNQTEETKVIKFYNQQNKVTIGKILYP